MPPCDYLSRIARAATALVLLIGCASAEAAGADGGIDYDFVIDLDSVVVPAAGEIFMCQYIPADGVDRWIYAFDADNGPASHHMTPYRVHDPGHMLPAWGPKPCGDVTEPGDSDGVLPGSVEAETKITLPSGVAVELSGDDGLYFYEHWLNTTSEPLTTHPVWRAATMPRAEVVHPAGLIKLGPGSFVVPPHSTFTERGSCVVGEDAFVVSMFGHMHHLGVSFDASVGGVSRYHTSSWNEPQPEYYDPPFEMKPSDALDWSCTYDNPTAHSVHNGQSATKNEMCVVNAIYYPTPTSTSITHCPTP